MSISITLYGLHIHLSHEVHYPSTREQRFAAAIELHEWAMTLVGSACRGVIMCADDWNCDLVFDDIVARATVAAEYEQALLWRDEE